MGSGTVQNVRKTAPSVDTVLQTCERQRTCQDDSAGSAEHQSCRACKGTTDEFVLSEQLGSVSERSDVRQMEHLPVQASVRRNLTCRITEDDISNLYFLEVEFYDELLFRAVYDPLDGTLKTKLRLPPGKHCICLLQAFIEWDESRGKRQLVFKRIMWRNELIQPLEGDPSSDGSNEQIQIAVEGDGSVFQGTSQVPNLQLAFKWSLGRRPRISSLLSSFAML